MERRFLVEVLCCKSLSSLLLKNIVHSSLFVNRTVVAPMLVSGGKSGYSNFWMDQDTNVSVL